jgi:hypothetical protein
MRRFARVVALPDPENVFSPAESILSYGWIAGYGDTGRDDKRGLLERTDKTGSGGRESHDSQVQ